MSPIRALKLDNRGNVPTQLVDLTTDMSPIRALKQAARPRLHVAGRELTTDMSPIRALKLKHVGAHNQRALDNSRQT